MQMAIIVIKCSSGFSFFLTDSRKEKQKSTLSDSYTTSRFHLHPSVQVERDLDTNQV